MPDKGKNTIYIADSALITADNLTIIKSQGIKFISRLPETFGIAREIKEWAWQTNNWVNLGSVSKKKNAAQYRAQCTIRELHGCKYRFIAIKSTRLDARKEKTITKQIENERQNLGKVCHNLSKRVFYCLADAEKEWQLFSYQHSKALYVLTGKIKEEVTAKRKKGRHSSKTEPGTH